MIAPRSPRFVQLYAPDSDALKAEAIAGLAAPQAHASPKFFYDRLGSHLFEAITELPEYYPTRTETAILERHAPDMARAIGTGGTLIDLGAGNCAKATRLMPVFEPSRYVAVDISVDFLRDALSQVQRSHPALDVVGVGMDFSQTLDLPPQARGGSHPVFFYPGSSIGNFTPPEALEFLRKVQAQAAGGGILLGVDLVKDPRTLQQAYDDALGVTAAFNLNLLRCMNRLIGSDFDPRQWQHVGLYDTGKSRIEMHLEAREPVVVRWPGSEGQTTERRFERGERIHTENSCKYTVDGFSEMLVQAGFREPRFWTDDDQMFAVFLAVA